MKVTEITCNGVCDLDISHAYISLCASVVRDKQPKSSEKLFNRLLTESIGNKASRVLEFIPCAIYSKHIGMYDSCQKFGFYQGGMYYTNARELLNLGFSVADMLRFVDFTNYRVFKCEAPYFIYGHVSTHTQLTTVSHSQRYSKCDKGYWKPKECANIDQGVWDIGVGEMWGQALITQLMKDNGVTRKEVFDRGRDMLQNRVFTIGGYTNNPNAWDHFIKQRLDSHTQLETREFAMLLSDALNAKQSYKDE